MFTFEPTLLSQVGLYIVTIVLKDTNTYPLSSLNSFSIEVVSPSS